MIIDYVHDDLLPWHNDHGMMMNYHDMMTMKTRWSTIWQDDGDDNDEDNSDGRDSYGVRDNDSDHDDKRANGEENECDFQFKTMNKESSGDDDNADEKANGEEKALIPKELNCQEAPRSNWAMSTILGRASASLSLFVN